LGLGGGAGAPVAETSESCGEKQNYQKYKSTSNDVDENVFTKIIPPLFMELFTVAENW